MSEGARRGAVDAAEGAEQGQTDGAEATASALTGRDHYSWRWSFASAVILSLTTLASAWSGYQAARWSSEQAQATREATAASFAGTRLSQTSERERANDVLIFTIWMEADELESARLADAALLDEFAAIQRAQDASQIGDNFVLTSVLYASVLFLAGISTKLTRRRSLALTVGISGAVFVIAAAVSLTLPINVGF